MHLSGLMTQMTTASGYFWGIQLFGWIGFVILSPRRPWGEFMPLEEVGQDVWHVPKTSNST